MKFMDYKHAYKALALKHLNPHTITITTVSHTVDLSYKATYSIWGPMNSKKVAITKCHSL